MAIRYKIVYENISTEFLRWGDGVRISKVHVHFISYEEDSLEV